MVLAFLEMYELGYYSLTIFWSVKFDQVEEREVPVEDLMEADEVFCTGTAVVVAPVGSITYSGKR